MCKNASSRPKNVLVIEPMGASGELLLQSVRRAGARAVVATTEEIHRTKLKAVHHLIDEPVYVDFSNPDVATKALVDSNVEHEYAAIVVSWEFLTDVAARVADELGLRGPRVALARARRNKLAMHHTWVQAGCPVPRLLAAVNPDNRSVRESSVADEMPLVIKPAENSASFGVTVIDSIDELDAAIKSASAWTHEFPHGIPFDRTVLIQEYVAGQEFSVEAVSDAGRFMPWGVTMKFTTGGSARAETGHLFPAPIPDALRDEILEVARRGVEALGVDNGISHTEIKLDANGLPRLIESGPRPAGDYIPLLVELATGESPTDVYVHQSVEGLCADFQPALPYRAAAIQFFRPLVSGNLTGVTFPDSIAEGEITRTCISAELGGLVEPGTTNMDRVGWAIVVAADASRALSSLYELNERVEVTVQ